MRGFIALCVALLLVLCVPSTTPILSLRPQKVVDDLRVGVVLPLSGVGGELGREILEGVQLALSEQSLAYWGSQGHDVGFWSKIQIVAKDSRGEREQVLKMVEGLLARDRVSVLLGGLSSLESLAYGEMAHRHGKMFVSLLPKWLQGLSQWQHALSFSSSHGWDAAMAARFLITQRGYRVQDIVVVVDDRHYAEDRDILQRVYKTVRELSPSAPSHSSHSQGAFIAPPSASGMRFISVAQLHEGVQSYPVLADADSDEEAEDSVDADTDEEEPEEGREKNAEGETKPRKRGEALLRDLAVEMILSRSRAAIVTLKARDSEKLLQALQSRGSGMELVGLDHWDHPRVRDRRWKMDVHYVTQYHALGSAHIQDQQDPLWNAKEFRDLSRQVRSLSVLSALSYDATLWLASLYTQARTVRVPQLMRVLLRPAGLKSAALQGSSYRLGQDHFMERSLVLVSLPSSRSKEEILARILPLPPYLSGWP